MLFGNTEAKLSGFLASTHKETCFLNLLLLCINCTRTRVLLICKGTFYDKFSWILELILHCLVEMLDMYASPHPPRYKEIQRISSWSDHAFDYMPQKIRWWVWKDNEALSLPGISRCAFRYFAQNDNTRWISPISILEKGTKKWVFSLHFTILITIQFSPTYSSHCLLWLKYDVARRFQNRQISKTFSYTEWSSVSVSYLQRWLNAGWYLEHKAINQPAYDLFDLWFAFFHFETNYNFWESKGFYFACFQKTKIMSFNETWLYGRKNMYRVLNKVLLLISKCFCACERGDIYSADTPGCCG